MREAWDHALEISRDPISRGELPPDPISGGELSRDPRVWRVVSVRSHLQLSSLRAGAWRSWLASLHDDAAFVRHLSAQRCADEVEAPYAQCKASALCAMGELEDEAYLACIRRTSRRALPPPGWVQAVKRPP